MTLRDSRPFDLLRALLLLLAAVALGGCAPMLVQVARQDPHDPQRYLRPPAVEASGAVTINRDGYRLDVHLPQQLRPGDEIETGPGALALIRLAEGQEIVLDARTRVRLGSFFVEFGRILARARGFFEAESENVVAGVEGTAFVFEVRRDRSVEVLVLDGAVTCRSKTQRWPPLRLDRGELFESFYPNAMRPARRRATPAEWEDAHHWVQHAEEALHGAPDVPPRPPSGFCCVQGELSRSTREQCGGRFYLDGREARSACKMPAPPGYCCDGGKVFEASRERCRGEFYTDRRTADANCGPPPGYCCDGGKVFETSRERCRGEFYADRRTADAKCAPPPGYCCVSGKISRSTREQCKGTFYTNEREAGKCQSDAPRIRLPPLRTLPAQPSPPSAPEPAIR